MSDMFFIFSARLLPQFEAAWRAMFMKQTPMNCTHDLSKVLPPCRGACNALWLHSGMMSSQPRSSNTHLIHHNMEPLPMSMGIYHPDSGQCANPIYKLHTRKGNENHEYDNQFRSTAAPLKRRRGGGSAL